MKTTLTHPVNPVFRTRKIASRTLVHLYLLLVASYGVFPFLWTLSSSFKTIKELYTTRPGLVLERRALTATLT